MNCLACQGDMPASAACAAREPGRSPLAAACEFVVVGAIWGIGWESCGSGLRPIRHEL